MFKKQDTAAIIVDVQNDFMPGGTLPIPGAAEIVPVINSILPCFGLRIFTQDWHPLNHTSFASAHTGMAPFSSIVIDEKEQTLWPDHCVAGSKGAEIHKDLHTEEANLIIKKAHEENTDSYSAFADGESNSQTQLEKYLRSKHVEALFVMGLTADFCVLGTAIDAKKILELPVFFVQDASRAYNPGEMPNVIRQLKAACVTPIDSSDLSTYINSDAT